MPLGVASIRPPGTEVLRHRSRQGRFNRYARTFGPALAAKPRGAGTPRQGGCRREFTNAASVYRQVLVRVPDLTVAEERLRELEGKGTP